MHVDNGSWALLSKRFVSRFAGSHVNRPLFWDDGVGPLLIASDLC